MKRLRVKWDMVETLFWFLLSSSSIIYGFYQIGLAHFFNGGKLIYWDLLKFVLFIIALGVMIDTYDEIKKAFVGTNAK